MNASLRFLVPALFLVTAALRAQTPSITGPALAGTERFDAAIPGLLTKFNSPGAQLAVAFRGRLLLARGYGIADREAGNVPVQPDSLFRIASNSKPLTALTILALVEQGKLSLDTKVFPFLGLTALPGATNLDARLQNITVQHLLNHTGGWDVEVSGDQVFQTTVIAAAAGVPAPADVDSIIRYQLGRRLDFDPGTRYAYANIGFVTLGRLIEKASGQSYADYVQANVLAKAGVTRAVLSRTLLANRQPGEVRYYDYPGAPLAASVFPPTNTLVPWPYGGFAMESVFATGGWAISTVDYVRLLCALDGTKPGPATIISPASIDLWTTRPPAPVPVGAGIYYGLGIEVQPDAGVGLRASWFHSGSLPGTRSYMVRFSGGWTYAIHFNTRTSDDFVTSAMLTDISNALNPIFSTLTPPATGDLFATAKPEINAAPAPQAVNTGATATITATISSVTSPTYQWLKNGGAISGETNAALTLTNVSAASAGNYSVVVTNQAGATTSATSALTINATPVAPTIAAGPQSHTVAPGGSVVFSVAATSTALSYEWRFNGNVIAGATDSTYRIASAATANVGSYTVRVFNDGGTSPVSAPATLTVTPGVAGRLINLSILTSLSGVADSFTMGYVVGGAGTAGTKPLVIRAAGPSLTPLGVGGALADPKLEFFAGSAKTGENDNWGGGASLLAAMNAVGAFAFTGPTSLDAAVAANVAAGDNSVKVSPVGNLSGTVIAEIYDASPAAAFVAATPRLINVSVLKSIGASLTAGFVVGGNASRTVLIRAIGPTLAVFGVGGTVTDPQLALFNSSSTKIGENDNWGGTAALTAAFTSVGAFQLSSPTSRDAALLVTLAPGNYTVQVTGVGGTTGVALVEVYEVP